VPLRPACFLDRDGVIIELLESGHSVREASQVRLCAGAAEAIAELRRAGFVVIVITNQPGPATGQYTRQSIDESMKRMHALLAEAGAAVDGVYVCMHHPVGGPGGDPALVGSCSCRKPKPGLLIRAFLDHGLELERSYMIGDLETDVLAGQAAGCTSYRIGTAELPDLRATAARICGQQRA
jgi:D-glycero-D-manno-heptose 1,7-bisphosphate phosphatase